MDPGIVTQTVGATRTSSATVYTWPVDRDDKKRSTFMVSGSPAVIVKLRGIVLPTTASSGTSIFNAETWMRKRVRALLRGYVGQHHTSEWDEVRIPELGEHDRRGMPDLPVIDESLED